MRTDLTHLTKARIRTGPCRSEDSDGANGAFLIRCGSVVLNVIGSDGAGWHETGMPGEPWEHVSVSLDARCPTWEEMDFVKRVFWHHSETVVQLHVPRSDHINHHPFCLHLWKPLGVAIPLPPPKTVGPVGVTR